MTPSLSLQNFCTPPPIRSISFSFYIIEHFLCTKFDSNAGCCSICITSEDESDQVCPLQDLPGGGVYPWQSTDEENNNNNRKVDQNLNNGGIYNDPRFFGRNTGIYGNAGIYGNNGLYGNTGIYGNTYSGGAGTNNRYI